VPGAGPVTQQIAVLPPPLCEVLDALPAKAVLAANAPSGPGLAVGGDHGVYHDGDHLLITVTAPATLDESHLYVAYVDVEGEKSQFVHLLPNDLRSDSQVVAGQQVVIGNLPPEIHRYGTGSPYGANMVIALATRQPLFAVPNSKWTAIAEFLPKLAAATQAQPDALIAYALVMVEPK